MAYNDSEGLVDLYGGVSDLERHIIRCVGDPMERFGEDALRILRAVRFSAQLDFAIEDKTREAIVALAPNLAKISAERICTEITKLIVSDHPDYLRVAYETGITKIVFPEFDTMMQTEQNNPHHRYTVGEHTLAAMKASVSDRIVRFALLFHDIGKPACKTTDENGTDHFHGHGDKSAEIAGRIMRRLKMDNDTIRTVRTLVTCHDWRPEPEAKLVRRMINKVGEELFPVLLLVQKADVMAQSEWMQEEKLERLARTKETAAQIFAEKQCVNLKTLAINGADLIRLGVAKGPEIGRLLRLALDEVLENPEHNEKAYLTAFVRKNMAS
jgi:tRNA nucleotidyltransferase (CCA-adding enzyme)